MIFSSNLLSQNVVVENDIKKEMISDSNVQKHTLHLHRRKILDHAIVDR